MFTLRLAILTLCLCFSASSFALDTEQRDIVTHASAPLIEAVLNEIDAKYSEVDNNSYKFKLKGYKVVMFNKGKDIQLYAGFKAKRITLSRINEWNKTKRFGRAYLDNSNDPVIEADLDFEGGVTAEAIVRFVALFGQLVEGFAEYIE
jgi:hypothetical protein